MKIYDLESLLSFKDRDFLIHNNGDQVKIKDLTGKTVGLYFSASWCPPCHRFTPKLVEAYQELSSKWDFEVVFISADWDEENFKEYFSEMPWLAIPFSDSVVKDSLDEKFSVTGIPHLVILNGEGKVLTHEGVEFVGEHQAEAYPFTPERIIHLEEEEEAVKRNRSLKNLLVTGARDFVISSDDKEILVSELEGKKVGLYFFSVTDEDCIEFTPKLVDVYNKLKEKSESFEDVMRNLDVSDETDVHEFKTKFSKMPWLALPFNDKKNEKLARYIELYNIPSLVIIGLDGKTLNPNAVEPIEELGVAAYPFSLEKLAEMEKAKLESQTLESVLVSGEKNFVIDKSGSMVPVSQLTGKHVLIYFSAH